MGDDDDFKNSLVYRWTTDFVGSSGAFSLFFIVMLLGGTCYSFRLITSQYLLLVFGVVQPILLTLCFYRYIQHCVLPITSPVFDLFKVPKWNIIMLVVDCCLIMVFAALIYFNVINCFIFRFVQTLFFPISVLVALRGIFVMTQGDDDNFIDI